VPQTSNFNLSKPSKGSTNWNTDLNNNFDTIDTEIKNVDTRVSALEIADVDGGEL